MDPFFFLFFSTISPSVSYVSSQYLAYDRHDDHVECYHECVPAESVFPAFPSRCGRRRSQARDPYRTSPFITPPIQLRGGNPIMLSKTGRCVQA